MKKFTKSTDQIAEFTDPDGQPWINGDHGLRPVAEYILYERNGHWPQAVGYVCRHKFCINPDHLEEITPELKAIDEAQFGPYQGIRDISPEKRKAIEDAHRRKH
jgi:hypothetical protein